MCSCKVVVIGKMWLYSNKMVVFGQSGSIPTKVVVFGQKWFYSGKNGCNGAQML